MLRWKYGIEREMKSVSKREKSPFFIISQNLLIKKNLFIEANSLNENLYGLDNFFSFRLKELNAHVLHIDNPVIHFGLESSESYIKKSLDAVKTTVTLEKRGLMSDNMRPIQQSFLKLKKWHLTGFFSVIISMFRSGMERNFKSENPNLFWFDLYRLNYYIQLKKENND